MVKSNSGLIPPPIEYSNDLVTEQNYQSVLPPMQLLNRGINAQSQPERGRVKSTYMQAQQIARNREMDYQKYQRYQLPTPPSLSIPSSRSTTPINHSNSIPYSTTQHFDHFDNHSNEQSNEHSNAHSELPIRSTLGINDLIN
eukprot:NODE_353_length_8928_cov_0.455204.p7 type:complete len:142 gc:universal NODE_353_length_8928_cov_0.455204:5645-6070(+)